jgi:Prismane/CO dehydrogenase family
MLQCEQTEHGTGCTSIGVCGKTAEVANMQDLLVYQLKGLSCWAHEARKLGTLLSCTSLTPSTLKALHQYHTSLSCLLAVRCSFPITSARHVGIVGQLCIGTHLPSFASAE